MLLDVFGADPGFGPRSRAALELSLAEGRVVACEVVWAETVGFFPSTALAHEAFAGSGIEFAAVDAAAASHAGETWRSYRRRGGTRERVIADFLIAAHAFSNADRLLTRDRGFYRTYFPKLRLLDPGRT